MTIVIIMGCLGILVWITGWLMHSFLTKGSLNVVRHIKKAYLESVLKQESAWFDQMNYTELASRISSETSTIETGIGHKLGLLCQSLAMMVSGLALGFFKGWSLALPMLILLPLMAFGMKKLIYGMTMKYIQGATAFATCSSFSEEALGAIRIVVAFGMEELEVKNYMNTIEGYNKVAVKWGVKAGFLFGFFNFCIYLGYSYAFTLGSVWIDQGIWNHAFDRTYRAGDIISIFFGVFFGTMAIGGLGPNIQGLAAAKSAGKKAFDIIDKEP